MKTKKNELQKGFEFSIIITLFSLLLFTGCNKEVAEPVTLAQQELRITKTTFNGIVTFPDIDKVLDQYKAYFNTHTTLRRDRKILIDTSRVLKTVENYRTSFALRLINPNLPDHQVENLVISKIDDSIYTSILQIDKKLNIVTGIRKENIILDNVNLLQRGGNFNCVRVIPICHITGGDYTGPHEVDSPQCSASEFVIDFSLCGNGGLGEEIVQHGNDNNSNTSSDGNTTSGGYNNNGTRGGVSVGILNGYSRLTSQIQGALNNVLSTNQLNWIDSHPIQASLLSDFLGTSPTIQQQNFALAALKSLINDGEVDYDHKILIASSVPECVKDIIQKIQESNALIDIGNMPDFVLSWSYYEYF